MSVPNVLSPSASSGAVTATIQPWANASCAPPRLAAARPAGTRAVVGARARRLTTGTARPSSATSAAVHHAGASRRGLPRSAVAIAPAWSSGPGIVSLARGGGWVGGGGGGGGPAAARPPPPPPGFLAGRGGGGGGPRGGAAKGAPG